MLHRDARHDEGPPSKVKERETYTMLCFLLLIKHKEQSMHSLGSLVYGLHSSHLYSAPNLEVERGKGVRFY